MLYEFTLTLRPRLYNKTSQEQYDYCYPLLRRLLEKYKCSMIAELTSENNVHFHAKIELENFRARDRLINQLRNYNTVFGRKTITQLVNEPCYDQYMKKDIHVTLQVIKDPIVMDTFEMLGYQNKYIDNMLDIWEDYHKAKAKLDKYLE